ncbi:MAG: ABC transporter permease [Thermoplasmatota archaeon]
MSVESLLQRGERPKPPGVFRSVRVHAWRAVVKIKHVPFQLFDVTVTPIMFTLLFTFLFGGALAGSPKEYVQFLAPGILVQTVVFITVYTGVGVNTDIKKGLHDRFRSLPNWHPAPIFGMLTGDLFRYSMASFMVLAVSFIIGFRPDGGILGVLAAVGLVLAFCLALSWPWIIIGMKVRTPESVMTMSFLVLFPLTFVSNIFVDPDTMPNWLQNVVAVNPVTHLATATRDMMAGDPGIEALWVLGAAVAIAAVFAPIAMVMYRKER